jgi:hypothetical protein
VIEAVLGDLKIYISVKLIILSGKLIHIAHARVMEFAACISILCASDNKAIVLLPTHKEGKPSWQMFQS